MNPNHTTVKTPGFKHHHQERSEQRKEKKRKEKKETPHRHNRDDPGALGRKQGDMKKETKVHHHQRHTQPNTTKEIHTKSKNRNPPGRKERNHQHHRKELAARTKNPWITNKETTAHHHQNHIDPPEKVAQLPTDQKAQPQQEQLKEPKHPNSPTPKHQEATKRTEGEADQGGTKHPLMHEDTEHIGPKHNHQNTDEDTGAQHHPTGTPGSDSTDTEAIDGMTTKNCNQCSEPYYQGPNANRRK